MVEEGDTSKTECVETGDPSGSFAPQILVNHMALALFVRKEVVSKLCCSKKLPDLIVIIVISTTKSRGVV